MKRPLQYKLNIFLFLLPALFLFLGVLIAPIILSVYYSLTDWNGLGTPTFIGLSNYSELFFTSESIDIFGALKNAFLLALLSCVIQLPLNPVCPVIRNRLFSKNEVIMSDSFRRCFRLTLTVLRFFFAFLPA